MTNEDAITILKMVFCENEYVNSVLNNAIDTAISALESHRWISVTERLPEYYETVIVYKPPTKGTMSEMQITHGLFLNPYIMSHWMPLPHPPYKVENDE